jgi:serralysin
MAGSTIIEASAINGQTYSSSGQSIEIIKNSGTDYIDSLFSDYYEGPRKWNTDPYLDSKYSKDGSIVISYSFASDTALYSPDWFAMQDHSVVYDPTAYKETQKVDIRTAFTEFSQFINISFVEVSENNNKVGSIRFFINSLISSTEGVIGDAVGDQPDKNPQAGDIIFSPKYADLSFGQGLVEGAGTYSPFAVLTHEIQHALGIEHPGDHRTISFPEEKIFTKYTVMTGIEGDAQPYRKDGIEYGVVQASMVYDIAALQYLYGANMSHNSGNNTYFYKPDTPFIETIWDAGGTDTLDFSNFSKASTISLIGGEYSTIGFDVDWSMSNNLGIAFNATIENASGGAGSDNITGNPSGNILKGNAGDDTINGKEGNDQLHGDGGNDFLYGDGGNDTIFADGGSDSIDGGGGIDTIKYTLSQANYILALGETNSTIKEISTNTNDSFSTIERIVFADNAIALDIDGANSAGGIYRTYKAAFNRTPDKGGFGYWIDRADNGASAVQMAEGFVWSGEFQTLYGVTTSDNYLVGNDVEAVVDLFYRNVLGRAPDQGGLDYYASTIVAQDKTGGQVLAEIADSAENRTNLLSTLENGMNYDLWVA